MNPYKLSNLLILRIHFVGTIRATIVRARTKHVDVVDEVGSNFGLVLEDEGNIIVEDVYRQSPALRERRETHWAKVHVNCGGIARADGEQRLVVAGEEV